METMATHQDTSDGFRRRLAAVVAADVVGYSRLMQGDPEATVADLDAVRAIVTGHTEAHGGRIADTAGDAIIGIFDTAAGAVFAGVLAQIDIVALAESRAPQRRMLLRVGVHIGDILEKPDGSVYGDSINIAARLQSLAPEGGVTASHEIRRAVGGQGSLDFIDQGTYEVKNIQRPVQVYIVTQQGAPVLAGLSAGAGRRLTKGNLPEQASPLIGREGAIAGIAAELDRARLVTLLGMGGMGKTRLSIETARRHAPAYPDGVWFADLAAVSDPVAVTPAVAGVFEVTQQAGKSVERSLVEALAGRRLLLILDNCEHVTEAAATLADALLGACPLVSIIATSREQLSISGEQVWPVAPLGLAGADAPALELFAERARAVRPGFALAEERETVAEICRALDGIPLAIELAAARVRSMTPAQIRDRLDQRFRLLTGGSRASSRRRHQTLRQAVQWSYDLMSEVEQTVLNRATVFAGGFSLEAAEAVCAGGEVDPFEICDILDSLVRKSLLTVQRTGGTMRHQMLETVRAFGAEQLSEAGEAEGARRRHAALFAEEADANFALWRSPRQHEAYAWLDLEINNLRNAFRYALDSGEVDIAARIASSVGDMGRFRLREEAANWAEEVTEAARAIGHPRLIVLLTWSASSAWAFSRFDDAQRFGEAALALLDDPGYEPFVWAYGDLAFVAIFAGDIDRAIGLLAEGAAHPADAHDRFIMAFHLYIMATAGRTEAARAIADAVVREVDAAGVPMSIAVAHGGRGAALEETDPEAALAAYEHAIAVAQRSGNRFMEILISPRLAALHTRGGDPGTALRSFERMLDAFGDATDIASVSAWRTSLVVLLARLGLYQAAATLHGSLADAIDASGVTPEHDAAVGRVREALGDTVFAAAMARGQAMSLREVSNYAATQVQLALSGLDRASAA